MHSARRGYYCSWFWEEEGIRCDVFMSGSLAIIIPILSGAADQTAIDRSPQTRSTLGSAVFGCFEERERD
ncbi:hypothetical protein NDU88_006345 [Pleurodeles waltl]|uniref:Uncharacterized protein n=1 Tax=Pleurodeles waltl TaxID=8319 RepID=A0AAV7LNU6_PLEWA|nr:hypothetical protein NDU88_006345 [Pleurodeles waltl]